MKSRTLVFLFVGAIFSLTAAEDFSMSGKWQVLNEIGGTTVDQLCTFSQKGNDLTGTCDTNHGIVMVTGKVDQKKVTWTYKSQSAEAGLITATYTGKVEQSAGTVKISGSVMVEEMGIGGTFTANQAK